jgi:16S rRNA A1518/A1519 N6-dimethyltransferase RsmA/KsgA/DIM1 with predicted DNA glycosylase/AP lyase activity
MTAQPATPDYGRLSVMLQWAAAYLTYQRSVRLITRNPSG